MLIGFADSVETPVRPCSHGWPPTGVTRQFRTHAHPCVAFPRAIPSPLVSRCPSRIASQPRPYVGNTRVINWGHTPTYWIRRLGGNTRPTMPAWSARDWRHTPVPHALTPLRRVPKGYTLGGPRSTPHGAPAPPLALGLRLVLNRLVPFHGLGERALRYHISLAPPQF